MIGPSGLQRVLLRLERLDHATAWLGATELPLALTSNRLAPFAASPLDEGLLAAVLDRLSAGAAEPLTSAGRSPRPRHRQVRPLVPPDAPPMPAAAAPRTRLRPVARATIRGGVVTEGAATEGAATAGAATGSAATGSAATGSAATGGTATGDTASKGTAAPLQPEPEHAAAETRPDAVVRAAARVLGGAAAIASPVATDWMRGDGQAAEGDAAAKSADSAAVASPAVYRMRAARQAGEPGATRSSAGAPTGEPSGTYGAQAAVATHETQAALATHEALRTALAAAAPADEQPGPDADAARPLRNGKAPAPGVPAPSVSTNLVERGSLGPLEHAGPAGPEWNDLDGPPPAHDLRPLTSRDGAPGPLEQTVPREPGRRDLDDRLRAHDPPPLPSGARGLTELVRRWEQSGHPPDGEPAGRLDGLGVQTDNIDPIALRPAEERPSSSDIDDALARALERLLAGELRRHGIDTEAG